MPTVVKFLLYQNFEMASSVRLGSFLFSRADIMENKFLGIDAEQQDDIVHQQRPEDETDETK